MATAPADTLPLLRQELHIEPGAPDTTGAPRWTLFDPIRHLFFQLGRIEYVVLSHWASGRIDQLPDALEREGLSEEEAGAAIAEVVGFGRINSLVQARGAEAVAGFGEQRRRMRKAWWRWAIDNYLFIRIPLVRPSAFLRRTLPRVDFFFSRATVAILAIAALLGLFLISRQWDAFVSSFLYFFSLEGLVAYGLGLAAVKVIHELGHAYMATRFGCRVPTMGVALLVMMPVLYTDTSGAWRLRSRRQRLLIDCAGMMAELAVAAIATLLWVMLPDGTLRSTAFILATTSWVMSLAINITPFMRFDGYYVLSDLSGIPNLQPRAFALGRWWLREALFGIGDEPPEALPRRTMRWMIVYAYATWLYRLVLFVGIALLVYHLFFKLLGLLLFIVEIAVFVARPIISELKAWYAMRDRIRRTPRFRYLAIGGGAALLVLALPTDMRISAPAMLSTVQSQPLVAGEPALLAELFVRNGQAVTAGTPIARLVSPDIDRAIARTRVQIAELEARSDRATADAEDRANLRVLRSDLAGQRLALAGLVAQRAKLSLVAPADGTITDIAETMTAGRWLSGSEAIARLISPRRHDVQAYVSEGDLWRLKLGATARFVPDSVTEASRPARLDEIASAATEQVEFPALASVNGGPIPVNRNDDGALKPLKAIYRVHLTVPNEAGVPDRLAQRQSGVIVIAARPSSPLLALFRRISRIWQAERPI